MLSYDSITEPESSDVMAKRGSGCNPGQWSQAVIILCTGNAGLTEPIHGDAEPVFNDWSRYQYVSAQSHAQSKGVVVAIQSIVLCRKNVLPLQSTEIPEELCIPYRLNTLYIYLLRATDPRNPGHVMGQVNKLSGTSLL